MLAYSTPDSYIGFKSDSTLSNGSWDRPVAYGNSDINLYLNEFFLSQKNYFYRTEIDELEEKIHKERERYQATSTDDDFAVSAIPMIAINDKVPTPSAK